MPESPLRVAIIGLDHWYCGFDAAESVARDPATDLAVVAHRDSSRAEETARRFGAAAWTTNYQDVIARDDIDVVVTACTVAENAALCIAAARSGKHIVSVKPIAMNSADAQAIQDAVTAANTYFISWDCYFRLSPAFQQVKQWLAEGLIGRPISGQTIRRTGLPTKEWPNIEAPDGRTWWLDPTKTVGGGWIDHSIYSIDAYRWLFGSEITEISGQVGQYMHPQLIGTPLEDFGLAVMKFASGQVAGCEVTWTASPGAGFFSTHVVGTEGAIILQTTPSAKISVATNRAPSRGWSPVPHPQGNPDPVAHMIACIQGKETPVASVTDARLNLEACEAFYKQARPARI